MKNSRNLPAAIGELIIKQAWMKLIQFLLATLWAAGYVVHKYLTQIITFQNFKIADLSY